MNARNSRYDTEDMLSLALKDNGRKGKKTIWAGAALTGDGKLRMYDQGRHGCGLQQKMKVKARLLLHIECRMQGRVK